MEIRQASSPRAIYKIESLEDGLVVVIELEFVDEVLSSHWSVSGVVSNGRVALLLQLRIGLSATTETEALVECEAKKTTILTLARDSAKAGGLRAPLALMEGMDRFELAKAHMRLLDRAFLLGQDRKALNVRTAKQYEVCKAFGLTSVVQFLAAFEQVPISTITSRLAKSRDAGLIPKTRRVNGETIGR